MTQSVSSEAIPMEYSSFPCVVKRYPRREMWVRASLTSASTNRDHPEQDISDRSSKSALLRLFTEQCNGPGRRIKLTVVSFTELRLGLRRVVSPCRLKTTWLMHLPDHPGKLCKSDFWTGSALSGFQNLSGLYLE